MSACRKISQLKYYCSFYLPVRHYNHEIRSHQFDSPDVYCCNIFSFVELCRLKLQFYVFKSRRINFIYFVIPLPLPKSCMKISPLCECTSVCIAFRAISYFCLSIDEMVGAWCIGCFLASRGLPVGFFSFVLRYYFIYWWVLPYLCFIAVLYLDLYVLEDDALIS